MMKMLKAAVVAMTAFTMSVAFAHEGHDHGSGDSSVKGTVESLDGSKLILKGADGKSLNVHVDDRTKYDNAGAAGSSSELVLGTRVVVHGEKMTDGTVHAENIRYRVKKSKGPATPGEGTPKAHAATLDGGSPATAAPQEHKHDHPK